MTQKRGRPKGSQNVTAIAEVALSRCPACGSSRRTKYENPIRLDYSGAGLEFVAIVYRTCRCLDCGQARRDQTKEYGPKEKNSDAIISRPNVPNCSGAKGKELDD